MMGSNKYKAGADKLGIASAVICTIHCLVVPVLFLFKYWWTSKTGKVIFSAGLPAWWELFDYLFLLVGFIAVYHAASHAAGKNIKIALWMFWLCLGIAVVFENSLHWMAYIASAGLIITHFVNIRKHQRNAVRARAIV